MDNPEHQDPAPGEEPVSRGKKVCTACSSVNEATSTYCYKCGVRLPEDVQTTAKLMGNPAGFWIRLGAYLVDQILLKGVKIGCTDIHLEPDTNTIRTRYRVDGILQQGPALPKSLQSIEASDQDFIPSWTGRFNLSQETKMRAMTFGVLIVIAVTISAAADARVEEGLVAHYTFERAEGSMIRDASGNGNAATMHNATLVRTLAGHGVRFRQKRDAYIDVRKIKNLDVTRDMSFAAWIKLEADPYPDTRANWTLLDCETHKKAGFVFRVDGGSARLLYRSGQDGARQERFTTKRLKNNTFYHVALTRLGKIVTVFVDGRADFASAIAAPAPPTQPLQLSSTAQSFTGLMEDVRLYNRALGHEEIQMLASDRKGRPMDKDQIGTRAAKREGPPVVFEGNRLKLAFSSVDHRIISFVGKDSFGKICPPPQRTAYFWSLLGF